MRTAKIGPDLPRIKTVRVRGGGGGGSSYRGRLYLQFRVVIVIVY